MQPIRLSFGLSLGLPFGLSLLCVLLAACSAALPAEALVGVESRAARKLRTQEIGEWIDGADRSLAVVVLDVKLQGGGGERRAYLQGKGDRTVYLGPLARQLPDAPLESLFFAVNGARFAVIWVDESVPGKIDTVTLGRPQQLPTDDSMNTLRAGGAANRVAIVPFAASEAELWNLLSDVLIYTGGLDFAWQHTYAPPIPVQPFVQTVPLP